MKEKNLLLKKNTFSLKRRRYSVLLSTSFILTLLTLFTLFFTRCDKDDYTGEVKGICPEVIVTDPVNGAINVSTNKVITATFNEPMQSATINESTFFVKNGVNIVSGHVTYSGTTATFTPASLLQANTVYTATVTRGATDPMGNVMRNDYTWSFNTGSLPRVILTDPVEGASDVKLDKAVTADFNTAMNAATVNSTSFLLKQGTTAVAGIVTYLGVKATFTPTLDLLPNKVYTATITNNVEDVAGNAMRNDTTWSFATGSLLLVIATDPLNGAVDVPYNKIVKATFNKLMNPATINNSTFTLMHGPTPVLGTVSYSEFTAEFTPLTDLLPGEEYTATITTGALDLSGNALIADYIWKFTTNVFVEPVLPVVLNTDPMDEAIDVPLDKVLKATFSKIMDPSSINSSTFTLMNGSTPVIGSINYSGVEATFSPITPLLPGTLYTATITTGAKDLEGNALADDYTWEFTTKDVEEPVLPVVISTDPVDEAIDVALYKVITATFSKTMDAATINASTFTVMDGSTSVTGSISYSGVVATFTPDTPLSFGTLYSATITTGAKDLAGYALADDYTWEFTTLEAPVQPVVINTDPVDEAINVALYKVITATFSKTMDAATINASTFTLSNGLIPVTGSINYSGVVATFTPDTPLSFGTLYTATITDGAKDVEGNALAADYTWEFTTVEAPVQPVVINTDPEDEATGVALDKVISATFSKIMDAATINAFSFIVMNGLIPVTGSINYSGVEATFTPNTPLLPGTSYTATITTGAEDLGGNAMAANYEWSFTTSAAIQWTVELSSDPTEGGNTSGGGLFNDGASVTVLAEPNVGYSFEEWTENDVSVSTLESYTFIVSSNRTLVANFSSLPAGPAGIDLGSAADFAILAGAGVTNSGVTTIITGDVGSFPTATIVGLLSSNVNGILYTVASPIVETAKLDLTTAYNDAQSRSLDAIDLPGQLGGLKFAPGLYVNSSTSGISGTGPQGILTLDAGGNPNAVWIFKMGSTLITDSGTSIVLAGGAQAKNIYWSVGSSATLGTNSIFYGNILADQSITITNGATLIGRALTRIAAVTLEANTVTKPE